MLTNFVIGFGGTGSKCLESFIGLCSAGLGPKDVWAGIVDQDSANGNFARCQTLLDGYHRCYTGLRSNGSDLGDSSLFYTQFHTARNVVWAPVAQANQSFERLCRSGGMSDDETLLYESLFSDTDRRTRLTEGFRGRPALGATVFRSAVEGSEPFWTDVWEGFKTAKTEGPIRILLMASIFGGTGAAGFPTVARLLRDEIDRRNLTGSVLLGGVLMLPYFVFRAPEEADDGQAFAESDAFLDNTRGALAYYSSLLRRKHVFDDFYVVGWNPMVEMADFEPGGTQQQNPAVFPELIAALAGARFLARESYDDGPVHLIGQPDPPITWQGVPDVRDTDVFGTKNRLAQALRFAFAFLAAYRSGIRPENWRAIRGQRWFRRLLKDVNLDDEGSQRTLNEIANYCRRLLVWFGTIQRATHTDNPVDLIDLNAFSNRGSAAGVELLEPVDFKLGDFPGLVREARSKPLHWVYSHLCTAKPNASRRGIGQFCGALHDLCRELENAK